MELIGDLGRADLISLDLIGELGRDDLISKVDLISGRDCCELAWVDLIVRWCCVLPTRVQGSELTW